MFDFLQKGFRVTIGATTVFLETLQDNTKREEAFLQIQTQWNDLAQEWEQKGEKTEEEARKIMNNFWDKSWKNSSNENNSSKTISTINISDSTPNSSDYSSDDPNSEVQSLTQQIVDLREELEKLRNSQGE